MAKLARCPVLAAPISKEESAWFDLLLARLCTLEATIIKRNLAIKRRLIISSPLTVVVVVDVVDRKSTIVVLKLAIQSVVVVIISIIVVVILVKSFPLIIEYIVTTGDEGVALSLSFLLLRSSLSLLLPLLS